MEKQYIFNSLICSHLCFGIFLDYLIYQIVYHMLRHQIKIAFRNFIRYKSFALINMFGLSFGLVTFILISLYIQYEFSWDKFNINYDRVYRLQPIAHMADGDEHWTQIGYPVGAALKDKYPEIEQSVVTRPVWGEYLSTSEKLTFHEDEGQYVEQSFFDVFTTEFIEGTPENALTEPYSIVLTESLRNKYFGDDLALGKFIKVNNSYELKVTGVIKDFPKNSSFESDYLSPIKLIELNDDRKLEDQWENFSFFTYFLLDEFADYKVVDKKIENFLIDSERYKEFSTKYSLWLNPLSSNHLLSDPSQRGLLIIVYLYAGIAVFALMIACINFMNLTTAYSVSRAKEIGIKKVVGSSRIALARQFIFESLLVTFISVHIAFVLAEFSLPFFNRIVSRNLSIEYINNWPFIAFIFAIAIVTGIIAGSYPAFYLSKFRPSQALKSASISSSKSPLRRVLVTFQFVISSILILSTLVMYKQFSFMKNKELGFNKEFLLNSFIGPEKKESSRKLELIKDRLSQIPEVKNVTVSQTIPFKGSQGTNVSWEDALPDERINARYNFIGYDYCETLGISFVEGRNFSREIPSDLEEACIINETAVKAFGWEHPIGKKVNFWDKNYEVVGVVRDFHPFSVFEKIPPFVFRLDSENIDEGIQHTIKISGGSDGLKVREEINAVYKSFFPNTLFDFQFMGDDVDDTTMVIYNGIVKTFLFFSMITILIAAVGMFGLVAFTTKSRTKEIGIRKVHGASSSQIFVLLAKEFVLLITIAIILSWPTGIAFKSIDPAAYKAETSVWEYAMTGMLVLLITFTTILYHTRKASKQNPSEALRYE